MPCVCFRGRVVPVEGILKVILSTWGFLTEVLAHLPVPPMPIVQHATMYAFFMMSGFIDIAMFYKVDIPPGNSHTHMLTQHSHVDITLTC